ncbi:hypothetical protein [Vibrio ulleungensis]|uniref:TnsA endonuclease N-terminal domain-containing protein n=1 Tax=Vibrio ulleungensis TaxID=2807619 RepID=A0ABS2HM42_9VIBR|nr:hypothetical protein [Vibrio ulleungensis]MBM7038540.1 hypothetical protein [Vibrio ulleungensis]
MRFDSKFEKLCFNSLTALPDAKVSGIPANRLYGTDKKLKPRRFDFALSVAGKRVVVECKDGHMRTIPAHKAKLKELKAKYRYATKNATVRRLLAAENDNHSIERNLMGFWQATAHDYHSALLLVKDSVWTDTWRDKYGLFMDVLKRDRYSGIPAFCMAERHVEYLPQIMALEPLGEPCVLFELDSGKAKVIAVGNM